MPALRVITVAMPAVVLAACSFITSTDGLAGGALTDGAAAASTNEGGGVDDARSLPTGDAEPDVPPPTTCTSPGTQCMRAPPAGWTGPFQIFDGKTTDAPGACPAPEVNVLATTADPESPALTCSPCACATSNLACPSSVPMQSYGDPSCNDAQGCVPQSVPANTCVAENADCGGSVKFTAPIATATCTAAGGTPTAPPLKWTREVIGCKAPSSFIQRVDCSEDQVCVPKPTPPFEAKLCVLQSGDVACPPPPYVNKRLVHSGFDDTRGCTACTCTLPSTPCTGGLAFTGSGTTCTPANTSTPFGGCFALGGLQGPKWRVDVQPPAVTCSAAGGAPAGALTPTGPITVCCM